MKEKSSRWNRKKIDEIKKKVSDELSLMPQKEKLPFLLSTISSLDVARSSEARLKAYVLIISALVHHQRYRGLKASQVENLLQRAYAILKLQGIKPGVSTLSFLFGEIHHVRSLIYRKDGLVWKSAWEQQLASYLSRPTVFGGKAFQAVSYGGRLLRLGHSMAAYQAFRSVPEMEYDKGRRELSYIGRIQALRLSGDFKRAKSEIDSVLSENLSDPARLEIEWEQKCILACCQKDLSPLVMATLKKGSHYQSTYLVETFLWVSAASSRKWLERVTAMRTLARDAAVRPKKLELFFKAALTIEECYDIEIPLPLRLKKLGDLLSTIGMLLNIDKEMLVWLAATRWLVRIQCFSLAIYTLGEYESLSRRLSGGRNQDVFVIAQDLFESDWYCAKNNVLEKNNPG
ncbi:MAG: hypothetical protein HQK54_00105 [Oligoflexales bacterium]|nr:hypothetical protein [Oligoflexales bacterium]